MLGSCLLLYKERITRVGNVIGFRELMIMIFEMGTKYVATHCEVFGAQGLRRLKSCDVSEWCDNCPP